MKNPNQQPRTRRATAKPLSIEVQVPAMATPMFRAFCELYRATPKQLATMAVLHFIMSETAVGKFDAVQNEITPKIEAMLAKH